VNWTIGDKLGINGTLGCEMSGFATGVLGTASSVLPNTTPQPRREERSQEQHLALMETAESVSLLSRKGIVTEVLDHLFIEATEWEWQPLPPTERTLVRW